MQQSHGMSARMLSERRESALVLTLSDPASRNSLSPEASADGLAALEQARSDPAIRCVVLRGDGAHFCGGGNLPRLLRTRDIGEAAQQASMQRLHGFVDALVRLPKPVIAAVEGFAAGAGVGLVLACDLVVAAEDAKFVLSYGRVGLSPDAGATWQLSRRLPRALVMRMLWLPEPMTARHWQALGLVNDCVAPGQTLDAALALAAQVGQMAPNAVASVKSLVNEAARSTLDDQLDRERDHFVANLFHDNGGEGIRAFLEKRAPRFSG
jgi:enoyl-CoA hydratase/carnithine racemase